MIGVAKGIALGVLVFVLGIAALPLAHAQNTQTGPVVGEWVLSVRPLASTGAEYDLKANQGATFKAELLIVRPGVAAYIVPMRKPDGTFPKTRDECQALRNDDRQGYTLPWKDGRLWDCTEVASVPAAQ